MTEVSHQPCPFCESSDAFSYNDETGLFKCYSCSALPSTQKCLVYDGSTQTPFTYENQEKGISLEPYVPDTYRGISKKVLEQVGAYFTKQGEEETVHWTYTNGTKHRTLPKSIKTSGQMDTFYGQDDYNSGNNITITEGEEDRLSVIQMMGDWPTVSVPAANPSKAFWENAEKYLRNFEKIILSIDNDHHGDALVEKFYRLLPGKVYRVSHGKYKDANEFLTKGARDEYKRAWWNAQKVKPDTILCSEQDFLDLYDNTPDYEYFETGIPELDAKMMGIHKGAFTLILAETGIGKTEFFRYLEHQALTQTEYTIATCHGEETPLRSLLGLVSYDLGVNVTRKDLVDQGGYEDQVKAAIKRLSQNERLYQFAIKVDEGIDDIISQVRFLSTVMEVDYIFLEPIQDFVSAANTSEKESLLTDLSNKLKRLASELNVGIVVIAHANKEGEAKYCASLVQSAAYEIRIERDVDAEDIMERNTTKLFVGRKNRTGGGSGPAGELHFDKDTFMLTTDSYKGPVFDNSGVSDVGF